MELLSKSSESTLYQYQDLQIEQKFIPPADWEFITRDSQGKIINQTWWGYEDGSIDVGFYIENFLKPTSIECYDFALATGTLFNKPS